MQSPEWLRDHLLLPLSSSTVSYKDFCLCTATISHTSVSGSPYERSDKGMKPLACLSFWEMTNNQPYVLGSGRGRMARVRRLAALVIREALHLLPTVLPRWHESVSQIPHPPVGRTPYHRHWNLRPVWKSPDLHHPRWRRYLHLTHDPTVSSSPLSCCRM